MTIYLVKNVRNNSQKLQLQKKSQNQYSPDFKENPIPHLPTSIFRFFDQNKEICASTMSNHTVFGHGYKLNR